MERGSPRGVAGWLCETDHSLSPRAPKWPPPPTPSTLPWGPSIPTAPLRRERGDTASRLGVHCRWCREWNCVHRDDKVRRGARIWFRDGLEGRRCVECPVEDCL